MPPDQPVSGPVTADPEILSELFPRKLVPKNQLKQEAETRHFQQRAAWTFSRQDLQFLILILFYFVVVVLFLFLSFCNVASQGFNKKKKKI